MNNQEIKLECELMRTKISSAQERLKELQAICKHEKALEVDYSYRVGVTNRADVCEYCGSFLGYK